MSSSDKDLIQESLQLFRKGVDSLVPLRHFSQHRDEAKIREAAREEGDKALMHFTKKLKASKISLTRRGALLNAFCLKLDKLTEEYVTRNQVSKKKSESFLQRRMEVCREDFQSSLNAKLLINPDMDLKSVEDFFESRKPKATDYFEHLWKHGNVDGFDEQKTKLEETIEGLKQETLEKQTRVLEIKEEEKTRKSLGEVREIVLAMATQVKFDIGILDGKVTKNTLKEKVQEIRNSLVNKGKVVKEMYEKLYMELMGCLEDSMKGLDAAGDEMSVKDAVEWAEKISMELQSSFVENEKQPWQQRDDGLGLTHYECVSAELELDESLEGGIEDNLSNTDQVLLEVATGTKRAYRVDPETQSVVVTSSGAPTPKKHRLAGPDTDDSQEKEGTTPQQRCGDGNVNPLNVPDKDGDFPLLLAIFEGQSVECIEKMLDSGADVNIKGRDSYEFNAAHEVINSLIAERLSSTNALAILNLLVAKGFNLLDRCCSQGFTPLMFAIQYKELNENILNWFFRNGADFNAVEGKFENSVLLQAICLGKTRGMIQNIIDFGGNPKYVNNWKWNAIHMSAHSGNESALEFFVDKLDVNEVDKDGNCPLHLLFWNDGLDHRYERCLKMLLRNGADFTKKNDEGVVPLVKWVKYGNGNPFPTVIKMKDSLSITEETVSATLTAILLKIEKKQKFLLPSSRSTHNEFFKFILFLIKEKKAKLLWQDENHWKRIDWQKIGKGIFTRNFSRELKTTGRVNFKGELGRVTSKNVGELELHTKSSSISVLIETIFACLLTCKNYRGFVELCQIIWLE